MSDENKPTGDGGTPAPEQGTAPTYLDEGRFKNYQAEMARKLENQAAQLNQILQAIQPKPETKTAAPKVSVFDDEEAYAARIKAETAAEIESRMKAQQAEQMKLANVANAIVREFPEANDETSPLRQRAAEIYAAMPDEDKRSPLAMKAAVTEAAAELGMKPKSKRSANDDSFALSGGGSSRPSQRQKEGDLDQATLEFARLLGRPVDDPNYQKSLKKAASRKNWRNYE